MYEQVVRSGTVSDVLRQWLPEVQLVRQEGQAPPGGSVPDLVHYSSQSVDVAANVLQTRTRTFTGLRLFSSCCFYFILEFRTEKIRIFFRKTGSDDPTTNTVKNLIKDPSILVSGLHHFINFHDHIKQ